MTSQPNNAPNSTPNPLPEVSPPASQAHWRAQSDIGAQPRRGPQPYREPWMRGTHPDLDPFRRAVVHALELTREDVAHHLGTLTLEQMHARPFGLPSVAFHLRHIVRSLDRLLTYAEAHALTTVQLQALSTEHDSDASLEAVRTEFTEGLESALKRLCALPAELYAEPRGIGRQQLPTTVAGLLIHCAEHTQRHTGQVITTAQLVQRSQPEAPPSKHP